MSTITDSITTADGTCPVILHTPDGDGPWPGVVMYPDAGGARQTFREMGDKLAGLGYAVLVPDVYYRDGNWAPFEMATVFSDEGAVLHHQCGRNAGQGVHGGRCRVHHRVVRGEAPLRRPRQCPI
jgi:dienelactone hydrolase